MPNTTGAAFFAVLRPLFGGKLNQAQVDGLGALVGQWNVLGDGDDRKLAYVLATAAHETAWTMQPVRETLASSDAGAKARLTKAWNAGKMPRVKRDYWSGGYFGRGYVQLTHKANYAKAGESLGLDLVGNPSLALEPRPAAAILIRGMLEGWFTAKRLGDYIGPSSADYVNARRVVNGTDRAGDIAELAETFEAAIRAEHHATDEASIAEKLKQRVEEAIQPAPETEEPSVATEVPEQDAPPQGEAPAPFKPDWWRIGIAAALVIIAIIAIF